MELTLIRSYHPLGTNGVLFNGAQLVCRTIELPWKNNARMISCIPEGKYTVVKMKPTQKSKYEYLHVCNVSGRDSILFHPGNYTSQILGCLLPGEYLIDLNKDGIIDVANTTATLRKMTSILPENFPLIIKKK